MCEHVISNRILLWVQEWPMVFYQTLLPASSGKGSCSRDYTTTGLDLLFKHTLLSVRAELPLWENPTCTYAGLSSPREARYFWRYNFLMQCQWHIFDNRNAGLRWQHRCNSMLLKTSTFTSNLAWRDLVSSPDHTPSPTRVKVWSGDKVLQLC